MKVNYTPDVPTHKRSNHPHIYAGKQEAEFFDHTGMIQSAANGKVVSIPRVGGLHHFGTHNTVFGTHSCSGRAETQDAQSLELQYAKLVPL